MYVYSFEFFMLQDYFISKSKIKARQKRTSGWMISQLIVLHCLWETGIVQYGFSTCTSSTSHNVVSSHQRGSNWLTDHEPARTFISMLGKHGAVCSDGHSAVKDSTGRQEARMSSGNLLAVGCMPVEWRGWTCAADGEGLNCKITKLRRATLL